MGSVPGLGRVPDKGNSNPSNILAWKTPWSEEPGSLGPQGLEESQLSD